MNRFLYITGEPNKKNLLEIKQQLKEQHQIELSIISLLTFDRSVLPELDKFKNNVIFILDMANLAHNKQLSFLEKQLSNKSVFVALDLPSTTFTAPPPISLENICATFCLETHPVDVHLPVFLFLAKLYLKSKKISDFNDELVTVKDRLDKLVKQTISEMKKIKKIHAKKVTFREDVFKGITFHSKYGAGESSGGDFYHVAKLDDHRVLLFVSGTNSYLFSSDIAAYFHSPSNPNKTKVNIPLGAKKCATDMIAMFKKVKSSDQAISFSMLCLEIDTSSLDILGYNFGPNILISNKNIITLGNNFPPDPEFLKRTSLVFKIGRNDRLAIMSPGVMKNDKQFDITAFVKEHIFSGHRLFLDELFYNLRRKKDGDLLSHDAMAIYVEVGKNVIIRT